MERRGLDEVSRAESATPYRIQSVDMSDAAQVKRNAGEFEAVIHCASTRGGDVDVYRRVYLEGIRNLIEAFPDSKIFFTSSTSVYGQTRRRMGDRRKRHETHA